MNLVANVLGQLVADLADVQSKIFDGKMFLVRLAGLPRASLGKSNELHS